MTWEETILFIRDKPEYEEIVQGCYYDRDLLKNAKSFHASDEFLETLRLIKKYIKMSSKPLRIIDVGAGNGIASVAFAWEGFEVVALEPDPSLEVGSGAINILREQLKLSNLTVVTKWGENMPFDDSYFDIVYARQAMHHAHDLEKFVSECSRIVRKGGLYMAIRDHVVSNDQQLKEFLEEIHPLNKFYHGENAFRLDQYLGAIRKAGLKLLKVYSHYETVLIYDKFFDKDFFKKKLAEKVGLFSKIPFLVKLYQKYYNRKMNHFESVPGRCYAFICKK